MATCARHGQRQSVRQGHRQHESFYNGNSTPELWCCWCYCYPLLLFVFCFAVVVVVGGVVVIVVAVVVVVVEGRQTKRPTFMTHRDTHLTHRSIGTRTQPQTHTHTQSHTRHTAFIICRHASLTYTRISPYETHCTHHTHITHTHTLHTQPSHTHPPHYTHYTTHMTHTCPGSRYRGRRTRLGPDSPLRGWPGAADTVVCYV